jgi:hypothetical protein
MVREHDSHRAHTRLAGLVAIAASTLAGTAGCANPAAEFEPFVEGVQRVPLGAEDGVARFFLGFPTKFSANERNWWYLRPEPTGLAAANGGLSAIVRFDPHRKVVERELIEWAATGKGRHLLRSERLLAGDAGWDEADFAAVLGEKLAELSHTSDRFRFDSHDTSYQLVADGVLLLSMDRWMRPGSQLISVRGDVDTIQYPQVAEAVRLAWQIRRFAIELDFDRGAR